MKISLDPFEVEIEMSDIIAFGKIFNHEKRIKELEERYPALQKGVARDPKPDEMKLQQGRKSPTRKPLAADHPASSHKKRSFYWTKERTEILQDNYFTKTMEELEAMLPGATCVEITAQAKYLGMILRKTGDKNGAGLNT